MNGKKADISDEAARLFENAAAKGPVFRKDAGRKKEKPAGKDDPHALTVDLHGLNLDQAVAETAKALSRAGKQGYTSLRAITGVGKHSPGLYSPLAAGIGEYLDGIGADYEKANGVFIIWLKP